MSPEPMDDREYREVDEHGEKEVGEDRVAYRQNEISRVNGIIWLLLGILEALIGLRVILKALAANPDSGFANFIYGTSKVFLAPFFGLVGEPTANGGGVLEITSIIAMVVYLLIAWGITRLVYLLMTPTHGRNERTANRH